MSKSRTPLTAQLLVTLQLKSDLPVARDHAFANGFFPSDTFDTNSDFWMNISFDNESYWSIGTWGEIL